MTEEIPINYDDTTKNDELKELVEAWRVRARTHQDRECQLEIENCADELELVLEDE